MPISNPVQNLFQQLVTLPDLCLVLGSAAAVCEMFLDPNTVDFRLDETSITLENGPWHVHLDTARIRQIAFVVTPDTAHGNTAQQSYSVRFFDSTGTALLRVFFLGMYDAQGHLKPARVQQYEALRASGGGQAVLVLRDTLAAPVAPNTSAGDTTR